MTRLIESSGFQAITLLAMVAHDNHIAIAGLLKQSVNAGDGLSGENPPYLPKPKAQMDAPFEEEVF